MIHPDPVGLLCGLQNLLRWPAGSRGEVTALQNRALRRVVRNAYERVPHYRRLFDGIGLTPSDIRGVDDLHRIPYTTRSGIQAMEPADICARGLDPDRLLVRRTSGSTGAPLTIRRHWMEERLLLLYRFWIRATLYDGVLRMRKINISNTKPPAKQRIYHEKIRIPRSVLDWTLPPERILRQIDDTGIEVLVGPPSLLCRLADCLESEPDVRFRPSRVYSGAEALLPADRRRLERVFGVPIYEVYGSHEFVYIAHQCPQSGYFHLCEESLIVEVLRDGKPVAPGEEGEMVGTALNSFAMPFIRYPQGDLVVRGPDTCPCGAPYKTLLRISGRVVDIFTLPDGSSVHPYEIVRPIRDGSLRPRTIQVVQERRDRIRITVVPLGHPGAAEIEANARQAEAAVAGKATVYIALAESIPSAEGGKFHPYVSYERYQSWQAAGINLNNIERG